MKLGYVDAIKRDPETDLFHLHMPGSVKRGDPADAADRNREYMRNPDSADAAIMRMIMSDEFGSADTFRSGIALGY